MIPVVVQCIAGREAFHWQITEALVAQGVDPHQITLAFDADPHLGCNAHTVRSVAKGLELSGGEGMILLEDDCIPSPDFMAFMEFAAFMVEKGHALTACAFSRLKVRDPNLTEACFLYNQVDAATAGFSFGGTYFNAKAYWHLLRAQTTAKNLGCTIDRAMDLVTTDWQLRPLLSRIRNVGAIGANTPSQEWHAALNDGDIAEKPFTGKFWLLVGDEQDRVNAEYKAGIRELDARFGRTR